MKELEKIINRYFGKDGNATVFYEIEQEEINKLIMNMKPYERPDILSCFDDKIIGIEHFEFDSYKTSRKGSDFQRKHAIIDSRMKERIKRELQDKETILIHDEIQSTALLDNYYTNFKRNFVEHYNKIDDYKEHIKSDFDCSQKNVEFWFFIEDVTPLGNYFLNDGRDICLLYPIYSDEIISLLQNSPKLKGIILGQHGMSKNKVTIIINNDYTLKKFKSERYEVTEKNFFSFDPHTTGFATLIPKEIIEGVEEDV